MANVYVPESVREACEWLEKDDCRAVAGATNLYVDRKKGKWTGCDLVSLHRLDSLREIREVNGECRIGSLVTFAQLERWQPKAACFQALQEAAAQVGAPQIRNRGTIGGNILSASPAADGVPPLAVLNARLHLVSVRGEREIPLLDFMKAPGQTDLQPGELLTEIRIPHKSGRAVFYKVGKRNALAVSVLNQAVYLNRQDGRIADLAIVYGSMGPVALRVLRTEALLRESRPAARLPEDLKIAVRNTLAQELSPIDDIRASREYRMNLAYTVLLENWRRLLEEDT